MSLKEKDLKKLEKLFYNPKRGFVNAKKLHQKAQENNLNTLSFDDVNKETS